MNSKLLSEKALGIIDHYLHFKIHGATTAIPYYNNNHKKIRAALRATTGKGSPKDIFDEVEISLIKEGVRESGAFKGGTFKPGMLSDEALRHFLVDQDIGIDCSGFAYYVLGAESEANKKGAIDRRIHFPFCKGILGKIRCKIRPVENADVRTFAHDANSHTIALTEVAPGDMITMIGLGGPDHILVIQHVEYQNFIPTVIHYAHSIAWPTDGEYGHGVRLGHITITDIAQPLIAQLWSEADKTGSENSTFIRATTSKTELRRLNWF